MAVLLQWLICSQTSSTHSNSLRLEHLHQLPSSPVQFVLSHWGSHRHHLNTPHLFCIHCEPRSSVHPAPSPNRRLHPFPHGLLVLILVSQRICPLIKRGMRNQIPHLFLISYVICFSETWLFPFKETMQLRMWLCRPARTPSYLTLWCLSFLMGEIEPSLAHRLILQDEAFRGRCPHMSPLQEPVMRMANRKFSLATSPKLSTWACVCTIIFYR